MFPHIAAAIAAKSGQETLLRHEYGGLMRVCLPLLKGILMINDHKRHSATNQSDTKFDESEAAYQPMLAIWAIKIAISCGWYRKKHAYKLPHAFQEDTFISLTGIVPPVEIDDDGDVKSTSKRYAKLTNAKSMKILNNRLGELAKADEPMNLPLFLNVEMLGDIVGL